MNAGASDFWNAETEASGKPVDKIMPTWIEQAGLPLVAVKTECVGKQKPSPSTGSAIFTIGQS